MTPSIKLVAYESRDSDKIFVAVPDERGRYMLTHRCVALVPCAQCRSTVGEPCKGAFGRYNAGTHYTRRNAAKSLSPKAHAPDLVDTHDRKEAELGPVDDWPVLEQ